MKAIKQGSLILAIVALLLSGCAMTEGVKTKGSSLEVDLSSSREVIVIAYGLSCPLCANNLDSQLADVDGVEGSSIDLSSGEVTVLLAENHSVSPYDLAAAVADAGFTLKEIKPKRSAG